MKFFHSLKLALIFLLLTPTLHATQISRVSQAAQLISGTSHNYLHSSDAPAHCALTLCAYVASRANLRFEQQSRGKTLVHNSEPFAFAIESFYQIIPYLISSKKLSAWSIPFMLIKHTDHAIEIALRQLLDYYKTPRSARYYLDWIIDVLPLIRKTIFGWWYTQNVLNEIKAECKKITIEPEITSSAFAQTPQCISLKNPLFHILEAGLLIFEKKKLDGIKRLRYVVLNILSKTIPLLKNIHISESTFKQLSKPLQQKIIDIGTAEDYASADLLYRTLSPNILGLDHADYLNGIFTPEAEAWPTTAQQQVVGNYWMRRGISDIFVPFGKIFRQT
ncbi:hypothetical protein FJ366_01265 [Candidatus Dependentiae bacterium]|nr:hypothetical protein [Candidatus Dependentiae bacterium]